MNTNIRLASVVSGAVAATAVALTTGIAIAAAAPAANGGALFICRDVQNPGNYNITIKGTYAMQEPDAYGYLKHVNDGARPGGMEYRLLADDEGAADNVITTTFIPGTRHDFGGFVKPSPAGIEYHRELSIPRTRFDEDNFLIDQEDEFYAEATFVDADGGRRTQVTQVIKNHFEDAGVCDGCCH